jgi:hypothetical protein
MALDRKQAAWWLWAIGTILIVLSWIDVVTPTVGWCGFAIGMAGSVMGWGLRPPLADQRRHVEMKNLIDQRITILRMMDRDALLSLSDSSDDIEIDGLPGKLNVFRESDEQSQTRIIVQGIRPSATGISALVIARGFLANSGGYARELRDDELYEYT